MLICPNCGKSIDEEDQFCRACGQNLQRSTVQKPMGQDARVPEAKQVQSLLFKHIRADETALWIGKPEKTPFIIPTLAAVPFGLLWMGLSLFWMWGVSFNRAPLSFTLFGLLFVLIGLGMAVGGPILGVMRYRNTEYMITDQRIITQTGAFGLDTRFVDFDKIQEVYVSISFIDKMFGTGTVLAVTAGYVSVGAGGPFMRPSLAALKEPYEVQKLLQEAIDKARIARALR